MRYLFKAASCPATPAERRRHTKARKSPYEAMLRRGALAVAVMLALAGCATSASPENALAWKVEPVLDVKHGAQSSSAYYTLGRYHDGSQSWDKASDAYRKAIAADERNVEAYNALGVALARSHRLEDAEAALRKAVGIAPRSAHVRSNLGFVLLLANRPLDAVSELQTALTLDRDNVTAHAHLLEALTKLEPRLVSSTAEVSAPASIAAEVPEALGPVALPRAAELQVIDSPTVPAFPGPAMDTPEPATPPSVPAPKTAPAKMSIRLELSNGNGIGGAAARLKQWLTAEGLPVERLTNQRPFDQQHTLIQYRAGHQEAALRVAKALHMSTQLSDSPSTGLKSDVRVVLGHDLARTTACLEHKACERPATFAAVLH
jgi:tetratricopeptide (TPR) repeat protein